MTRKTEIVISDFGPFFTMFHGNEIGENGRFWRNSGIRLTDMFIKDRIL